MKLSYIICNLILLSLLACKVDDNDAAINLANNTIVARVFKGNKNISNFYQYSYGIGSGDTLIKPVKNKTYVNTTDDQDTIIPLYLNIFKDTSTFVLVDKSDVRDTIQFVYHRTIGYQNQYARVALTDRKITFISSRISRQTVNFFFSLNSINIKLN